MFGLFLDSVSPLAPALIPCRFFPDSTSPLALHWFLGGFLLDSMSPLAPDWILCGCFLDSLSFLAADWILRGFLSGKAYFANQQVRPTRVSLPIGREQKVMLRYSPSPVSTDGEASNPGPGGAHRLRRRGPRSLEARERFRQRTDARALRRFEHAAQHAAMFQRHSTPNSSTSASPTASPATCDSWFQEIAALDVEMGSDDAFAFEAAQPAESVQEGHQAGHPSHTSGRCEGRIAFSAPRSRHPDRSAESHVPAALRYCHNIVKTRSGFSCAVCLIEGSVEEIRRVPCLELQAHGSTVGGSSSSHMEIASGSRKRKLHECDPEMSVVPKDQHPVSVARESVESSLEVHADSSDSALPTALGEVVVPDPALPGGPTKAHAPNPSTSSASARSTFLGELLIFHVNIRGLVSRLDELTGRLRLLPRLPHLVCLNETFLDEAKKRKTHLENYVCVVCACRDDGRGGVAVFVHESIQSQVTLLGESDSAERVWLLVHSDLGPLLVCPWYRPPASGCDSIHSLPTELETHRALAIATIVVGDLNVHNKRWLRFSSIKRPSTPEGVALCKVAAEAGLKQLVQEPTRGRHLLDLVLSDLVGVKAEVLPAIADHKVVLVSVPIPVPTSLPCSRTVWTFAKADWERLDAMLAEHDWSFLVDCDPSQGAQRLTDIILSLCRECIPQRLLHSKKSTHPWLTDEVLRLITQKNATEGSLHAADAAKTCSEAILAGHLAWTDRTRHDMCSLQKMSKQWWAKSNALLSFKQAVSSIPALRNGAGQWVRDSKEKADLFANTFSSKYSLAEAEQNKYSDVPDVAVEFSFSQSLQPSTAEKIMSELRAESGTGPDLLPARILKKCAKSLSTPVTLLALSILHHGQWPLSWIVHWILPLYKRRAVFDTGNYRGIHLSTQLSKVVERLLGTLWIPHLSKSVCCGPNQFAYQKEKGSRDALAFLFLTLLRGFQKKSKFGFYCSDVSGAFDRVQMQRLLAKMRARKMPEQLVKVISSWLERRVANVVVEGQRSADMELHDMLFQGTVWGPVLWNCFYADANVPLQSCGFLEIVFADDLNALKEFASSVPNDRIVPELTNCQRELHEWGRANQVAFDASKESFHVLSRTQPYGGSFKLLGIKIDPKLLMDEALSSLVDACRWKRRVLLQSQRHFTGLQLVDLYKAHVLSYIEYRTPAIYHACTSLLAPLDHIQDQILEAAGMTPLQALFVSNLAPLATRRDIAMLGVIHRAVLGKGPHQLHQFFQHAVHLVRPGKHRLQVQEYSSGDSSDYMFPGSAPAEYISRSALGLTSVYNVLPASIVESSPTVSCFQSKCQALLRERAMGSCPHWDRLFSPRWAMYLHPLRAHS